MANTVLASGYPKLVQGSEDTAGTRHRAYSYDFNPNSTYGTGGGILVSPNLFGISTLTQIESVVLEDVSNGGPGGYVYMWNQATGAIQFFEAPQPALGATTFLSITNIAETAGNVVTLSCSNSLPSGGGSVIALTGLTTGTWLNGLIITTTSATASTIVFTDPTGHGTQSSHAETGTGSVLNGTVGVLSEIGNISVSSVIVRGTFKIKP